MCFQCSGKDVSHEMCWQESEDLQCFLGMVSGVRAGILAPAASKKQVPLRLSPPKW